MKFSNVLSFRKDIFFDGAVQLDWFYNREKASNVAKNFVFHGSEYFGVKETGGKSLTDTIQFVADIASKVQEDQHVNPLTLAIAGYGTGKSHLAVTLAQLLSGEDYQPETHELILKNIEGINKQVGKQIRETTKRPNLVLAINGMRDFNLHYELLKAAQKSLRLYGCSDDRLKKINRAIETAFRFFERNAESSLRLFEEKAAEHGYSERGQELVHILREQLGEEESAFNVINAVYNEINGNEIRWDEGVSASAILEALLIEYCGISGPFNKIIIIFDEFGRYLEYASSTNTARSGDSALQQIFESAQNADGSIQVINFIQSDIKSYLQRVDQTSNISRYIGRYDASDKYYLSSNLETVFANLIERRDKSAFDETIKTWQREKESVWKSTFEDLNRWLPAKGLWKDYQLYRQVIVEGIYPLHPLATYMLSQLSDYLQNRSSLMLLGKYVNGFTEFDLTKDSAPFVYPEALLEGDLFTEMLSAEEEGRQYSQHCIRYNNILRKYSDKLSADSLKILRANLALRILRCRTKDYSDVKHALMVFSGLPDSSVEHELVWLENEYAILGYDEHTGCFDFLEDSSGAHDFKTFFKRLRANTVFSFSELEDSKVRELADVLSVQPSNFGTKHKIKTNEWQFEQDMFPITDISEAFIESCVAAWKAAVSPEKIKGKLIWLYINRDCPGDTLESVFAFAKKVEGTPIVLMLLNDVDDRLKNALCEYAAIQNVSGADQQKYGRHYVDKLQETEENLRNAFDVLKKQRLHITSHGVEPFSERLAVALTDVFENVYPQAVPFDFDGFDGKQQIKARKAFCSITRLLLSGSLNDDTVHSFPADVRNRLEASLSVSGAFSWKIINANYQVVPPEQKHVREVYDEIVGSLPEGGELQLEDIISKLVAPPFGMNDYVAVYMLVAICANLSYCLRIVLNASVFSINTWKDEVIGDNKVDLALIKKSTLKRVNAGAVADQFLRLFARIDSNMDCYQVAALSNELEQMKQSENIPDELTAQYQLALNKLQEGLRVKNSWVSAKNLVLDKYDSLLEKRDIYSGLQAIQIMGGLTFYDCFKDSSYAMTEEQREELNELKGKIRQLVDPFIVGWISEQRCRGVENITQYRKHMERLRSLLSDLGYSKEADLAAKRAESELSNVEEIRARQELRAKYSDFLQNCTLSAVVPFTRLLEWKKQGEALCSNIEKFAASLGKDYERMRSNAAARLSAINDAIDQIRQDMNDIYDDIYNVSSVDDVRAMVERIHLVCQKGIAGRDLADFNELKNSLEAFLQDINALVEAQNDREQFDKEYSLLMQKYQEAELDFDVLAILEQVANSISASLDHKEKAWESRYICSEENGRSDLLAWVDETRLLPKYLSERAREKFEQKKRAVEKKLSQAKVDDVVYSFKKLNEEEREECFDKLVDIYKKDKDEKPDSSHTPARNKRWDLEEWVVLAQLYFANKEKTRTELSAELEGLSQMLIRRADMLGIDHDDKYRNVNGLAMQFDRLKYMDTGGEKGLSAYSALGQAAIDMYYREPEEFERIAMNCWDKYRG